MLDLIGTVVAVTAIAVILISIVSTLALPLSQRIVLTVLVGLWVSLATGVAAMGVLTSPGGGAVVLLPLFTLPLAVTGTAALLSPGVRSTLLAIPTPLLIGLNAFRVGGVLFVMLAEVGRLGGPFPYIAGWGDVITGVAAIPAAWVAAHQLANRRGRIMAWNAFGALDLIVAVVLGVTSRNGSPLQLIHAGVGTAGLTHLPWSLLPTVLVPYFLISHALVFAQLRSQAHPGWSNRLGEASGALG
ncbi:MAG: hypothetical protein JSR66_24750 [Proteobacteria bacterium]|nr:hypothetical protein [Pseudomonadota bacterium]